MEVKFFWYIFLMNTSATKYHKLEDFIQLKFGRQYVSINLWVAILLVAFY
jgi:hypothetical protein